MRKLIALVLAAVMALAMAGAVMAEEVPEGYSQVKVFDGTYGFGDAQITAATNDDFSAFYVTFECFDEEQILEGTVEDGIVAVDYDLTGFVSGDAQVIWDDAMASEEPWTAIGGGDAASEEPAAEEPAAEAAEQASGLVQLDNGFYNYTDENGELVKFDYVQTDDGKLYFFNSQGTGVEIEYLQVDDHVIQIFDNTADSCFIVIGDEKAAVIDGMNGTIDLAVVAKFFTDKPLIAIATHGHGDHTGGLQNFDEVYIGEADFDMWPGSTAQMRYGMLGYDNYLAETGKTLDYSLVYLPEDMMEVNPDVKLIPLNDGDVFDLGGVSIEALSLVGHTPGSCAILIREDRMLITGDAANKFTQITGYPVEGYLQNLQHIKDREADYDTIYSSHGAIKSDGSNGSLMAPTMIDELIEGCESILDGSNEGVEPGPGSPTRWAYEMGQFGRVDGKCGNFMFSPDLIWIEGSEAETAE